MKVHEKPNHLPVFNKSRVHNPLSVIVERFATRKEPNNNTQTFEIQSAPETHQVRTHRANLENAQLERSIFANLSDLDFKFSELERTLSSFEKESAKTDLFSKSFAEAADILESQIKVYGISANLQSESLADYMKLSNQSIENFRKQTEKNNLASAGILMNAKNPSVLKHLSNLGESSHCALKDSIELRDTLRDQAKAELSGNREILKKLLNLQLKASGAEQVETLKNYFEISNEQSKEKSLLPEEELNIVLKQIREKASGLNNRLQNNTTLLKQQIKGTKAALNPQLKSDNSLSTNNALPKLRSSGRNFYPSSDLVKAIGGAMTVAAASGAIGFGAASNIPVVSENLSHALNYVNGKYQNIALPPNCSIGFNSVNCKDPKYKNVKISVGFTASGQANRITMKAPLEELNPGQKITDACTPQANSIMAHNQAIYDKAKKENNPEEVKRILAQRNETCIKANIRDACTVKIETNDKKLHYLDGTQMNQRKAWEAEIKTSEGRKKVIMEERKADLPYSVEDWSRIISLDSDQKIQINKTELKNLKNGAPRNEIIPTFPIDSLQKVSLECASSNILEKKQTNGKQELFQDSFVKGTNE